MERLDRAALFQFEGDRMWVLPGNDGWCVPVGRVAEGAVSSEFCELWKGLPAMAVDVSGLSRPDGMDAIGLRALFEGGAAGVYTAAERAYQVVHWRRTHRYCGSCGEAMRRDPVERAMACEKCRLVCFPRINPVVITRITRGDEILLARRAHPQFRFYSVIAGYVEAGERLEEAVRREIREEVGLEVRNIRYFGSQPWSFPNNLMIGFTAEHAGGEIQIDGVEIGEAKWFARDSLPRIPSSISISRQLIDDYIG